MKSPLLILLIFLTQYAILLGQNLVPNPDFDQFLQCPPYLGQIHQAIGWDSPNFATSDYFHSCSDSAAGNGVPVNRLGRQVAAFGRGYAGIRLWIPPGISTPNQREYLVAKLTDPLKTDSFYEASMLVSLSDFCTHTTDALGIGLSDSGWSTERFIPFQPILQVPEGDLIQNRDGWVKYSGMFQANGGEQHLIIGNYLPDSLMNLVEWPPGTEDEVLAVYVFIDQVEVKQVPPPDTTVVDTLIQSPDTMMSDSCLSGKLIILNQDSIICQGSYWAYRLPVGAEQVVWDNGLSAPFRILTNPGLYQVGFVLGCDTVHTSIILKTTACDCDHQIPNVFSPNGNGIKDVFGPDLAPGVKEVQFRVVDRWGRLHFQSNRPDAIWDGRIHGQPSKAGVYFWSISYQCQDSYGLEPRLDRGTVTLFR